MRYRYARALIVILVLATAFAGAGPAYAGGPTRVTLTGPGLAAPIVVRHDQHPELFEKLRQVVYRAGLEIGTGAAVLPRGPSEPGPGVVMRVDFHDIPTYEYVLHPYATGGPHLFVPARQPKAEAEPPGHTGWYLSDAELVAALTAAKALAAGAPAEVAPASPSGGSGAVPEQVAADRPAAAWAATWWAGAVALAVLGLVWLAGRPLRRSVRRSLAGRTNVGHLPDHPG